MRKNDDEVIYEIENWKKFNPRNDYKSIPWFRFDVNLFRDPRVAQLNASGKLLWIFLLTECGRCNNSVVTLNIRLTAAEILLKPKTIREQINRIEELQLLKINSRTWRGRNKAVTKRNERNETNETKRNVTPKLKVPEEPFVLTHTAERNNKSHWLIELWNELKGELPEVKVCNDYRKKTLIPKAIKAFPNRSDWDLIFKAAAKSYFLNGGGSGNWKASFDWCIKPTNATKILEGNYDGGSPKRPLTREETISMANQELYWKLEEESKKGDSKNENENAANSFNFG